MDVEIAVRVLYMLGEAMSVRDTAVGKINFGQGFPNN